MKTLFLSLGHNKARNLRSWYLQDQWAVDPKTKITEYSVTKTIADKFMGIPKKYAVLRVPEGLTLEKRTVWINERRQKWDISIELHMNSGWGTWTEILYNTENAGAEMLIARNFIKVFADQLGVKNRGDKPDTVTRFWRAWFCRDIGWLSLLLEVAFIDNAEDRRRAINWWAEGLNEAIKTLP